MTTYIPDIAHYNEVLAPTTLIAKVRKEGIAEPAQQNEEYKFKVYKK